MRRRSLLVLLAATATLLGGLPALASGWDEEQRALGLLGEAADAARSRSYSGTQYVGSWRAGTQTSAVLDVVHRPGTGSRVTPAGNHADARGLLVPTTVLDERLLRLLADHYALDVAGWGRCAGRQAVIVEARREGRSGPGSVAGRFWLDDDTALVLRREVYDQDGARLRSSAFVDLRVEPGVADVPVGVLSSQAAVAGRRIDADRVSWDPPRVLPGELELFDARARRHGSGEVLHLAYSDGLSTLSVFAQRGSLAERPGPGFHAERLGESRVWVSPAAPARMVWQGNGRVFTLISDAEPATLRAAIGVLPHDPVPDTGVLARLRRGLARVGSWLNPFS